MTTPIPEAAVEAAARVIDHDAWTLTDAEFFEEYDDGMHGVAYCLRNRGARKETSLIHARAALTAARPLMEAEIRGQVAADCRVEAENVDLEVPNAYREGTRDGYLSAATIAESAQR